VRLLSFLHGIVGKKGGKKRRKGKGGEERHPGRLPWLLALRKRGGKEKTEKRGKKSIRLEFVNRTITSAFQWKGGKREKGGGAAGVRALSAFVRLRRGVVETKREGGVGGKKEEESSIGSALTLLYPRYSREKNRGKKGGVSAGLVDVSFLRCTAKRGGDRGGRGGEGDSHRRANTMNTGKPTDVVRGKNRKS